MAKRTSLREFQQTLSERLGSAKRGETLRALLGIASGSGEQAHWVVDLADAGEVVPLPVLAPVPLTRRWLAGIANIRGTLYSVVDFAAFRGEEPTPRNAESRLLLIGARHGINCALLVSRTLGLKPPAELTPVGATVGGGGTAGWRGDRYDDTQGLAWTRLLVPALVADPEFLDIAA